ncbi:MAG: hypothetical protein EBX40_00470 [Gammaproteobacteria bacterium]|nr:hypothetical protein [Gammaproteobacteria bacterium]
MGTKFIYYDHTDQTTKEMILYQACRMAEMHQELCWVVSFLTQMMLERYGLSNLSAQTFEQQVNKKGTELYKERTRETDINYNNTRLKWPADYWHTF